MADFVRRHFGEEANRTLAGPLLAGIFGGDTRTLSVRAVMPAFVQMEAEHGSLITALRRRPLGPPQAVFSTLANGLESLIDADGATASRGVRASPRARAEHALRAGARRCTRCDPLASGHRGRGSLASMRLSWPLRRTSPASCLRSLGSGNGERMADLLPSAATSAIVVAMAFDASQAEPDADPARLWLSGSSLVSGQESPASVEERALLACTFLGSKIPPSRALRSAPAPCLLWRRPVEALLGESDEALVALGAAAVGAHLHAGSVLPEPALSLVRRWPRSLPQYAVGHLERIAELERWPAAGPVSALWAMPIMEWDCRT